MSLLNKHFILNCPLWCDLTCYFYHGKSFLKIETGLHTRSKKHLFKKICYIKENFPFQSSKGQTYPLPYLNILLIPIQILKESKNSKLDHTIEDNLE